MGKIVRWANSKPLICWVDQPASSPAPTPPELAFSLACWGVGPAFPLSHTHPHLWGQLSCTHTSAASFPPLFLLCTTSFPVLHIGLIFFFCWVILSDCCLCLSPQLRLSQYSFPYSLQLHLIYSSPHSYIFSSSSHSYLLPFYLLESVKSVDSNSSALPPLYFAHLHLFSSLSCSLPLPTLVIEIHP